MDAAPFVFSSGTREVTALNIRHPQRRPGAVLRVYAGFPLAVFLSRVRASNFHLIGKTNTQGSLGRGACPAGDR